MSTPKMEHETSEAQARRLVPAEPRPGSFREPYGDEIDLREYLEALRERWRLIAGATILAMLVTAVITIFFMTKWYRAEAIIRPVTAGRVQSRLSGLLGGLGGLGGAGGAGGLLGNEAANPASEYMPVLKSFDFTTQLIARHGLESHLRESILGLLGGAPADPDWARYRVMRKRFDCEFSIKTGNLTLYYQDPDRTMAGKVLGFYISDLRERLRQEEIHDTAEAIASLRMEVQHTSDTMLQTQLYELLARQIQQQKLAQVQADFAFKVLQSPTTPDRPYRPRVMLDCLLAGMLALMLATLAIILKAAPER